MRRKVLSKATEGERLPDRNVERTEGECTLQGERPIAAKGQDGAKAVLVVHSTFFIEETIH